MPVSQPGLRAPNGRLDSLTLPVNAPRAYLRHRAAAKRAHRERKRRQRLRRLIVLGIALVLYLLVGREFVRLLGSHTGLTKTRARTDIHIAGTDLGTLGEAFDVQVTPPLSD